MKSCTFVLSASVLATSIFVGVLAGCSSESQLAENTRGLTSWQMGLRPHNGYSYSATAADQPCKLPPKGTAVITGPSNSKLFSPPTT